MDVIGAEAMISRFIMVYCRNRFEVGRSVQGQRCFHASPVDQDAKAQQWPGRVRGRVAVPASGRTPVAELEAKEAPSSKTAPARAPRAALCEHV